MNSLHKQLDERLKSAGETGKRLEALVRRTFSEVYEYCKEVFGSNFQIVPWSSNRSIELKQPPEIEKIGINSLIRIGVNNNKQAAVLGIVFPSSGAGFLMHWLWATPETGGIQFKYGELAPINLQLDAWDGSNAEASRTVLRILINNIIIKYIEYVNSIDYAASLSFYYWERMGERR